MDFIINPTHSAPFGAVCVCKVGDNMFIFALCLGVILGLMIGTYLGAQIIDEKNRELKYLRSELARAAYDVKEEGLF